jgi:serine/threonine protein kinase
MAHIESGVLIDSRYTIVERIGTGTTGLVYKATALGTQQSFAIKHFNAGPVTSFEEILQRREIDV